jgi:hypothetical protein
MFDLAGGGINLFMRAGADNFGFARFIKDKAPRAGGSLIYG